MDSRSDRLLPASTRRPAAIIAILGAVLVVALGVVYAGDTEAGPFDQGVFDLLLGNDPLFTVMSLTSAPAVVIGVICVLVGVALSRRRFKRAGFVVLGPLLTAAATTWVLKPLFNRTHDDYLAYPSGHTGTVVAVLTVLVLIIAARGSRVVTAVAIAAALGYAVLTATALVGLEYHYLTDTIGALGLAVAVVIGTAFGLDLIDSQSPSDAPPSPEAAMDPPCGAPNSPGYGA